MPPFWSTLFSKSSTATTTSGTAKRGGATAPTASEAKDAASADNEAALATATSRAQQLESQLRAVRAELAKSATEATRERNRAQEAEKRASEAQAKLGKSRAATSELRRRLNTVIGASAITGACGVGPAFANRVLEIVLVLALVCGVAVYQSADAGDTLTYASLRPVLPGALVAMVVGSLSVTVCDLCLLPSCRTRRTSTDDDTAPALTARRVVATHAFFSAVALVWACCEMGALSGRGRVATTLPAMAVPWALRLVPLAERVLSEAWRRPRRSTQSPATTHLRRRHQREVRAPVKLWTRQMGLAACLLLLTAALVWMTAAELSVDEAAVRAADALVAVMTTVVEWVRWLDNLFYTVVIAPPVALVRAVWTEVVFVVWTLPWQAVAAMRGTTVAASSGDTDVAFGGDGNGDNVVGGASDSGVCPASHQPVGDVLAADGDVVVAARRTSTEPGAWMDYVGGPWGVVLSVVASAVVPLVILALVNTCKSVSKSAADALAAEAAVSQAFRRSWCVELQAAEYTSTGTYLWRPLPPQLLAALQADVRVHLHGRAMVSQLRYVDTTPGVPTNTRVHKVGPGGRPAKYLRDRRHWYRVDLASMTVIDDVSPHWRAMRLYDTRAHSALLECGDKRLAPPPRTAVLPPASTPGHVGAGRAATAPSTATATAAAVGTAAAPRPAAPSALAALRRRDTKLQYWDTAAAGSAASAGAGAGAGSTSSGWHDADATISDTVLAAACHAIVTSTGGTKTWGTTSAADASGAVRLPTAVQANVPPKAGLIYTRHTYYVNVQELTQRNSQTGFRRALRVVDKRTGAALLTCGDDALPVSRPQGPLAAPPSVVLAPAATPSAHYTPGISSMSPSPNFALTHARFLEGLGAETREMFHGTSPTAAEAIKREGGKLKVGSGGLLGCGIYLAATAEDARSWCRHTRTAGNKREDAVVLRVRARMGRTHDVTAATHLSQGDLAIMSPACHSVRKPRAGYMGGSGHYEYCVYDSSQVEVVEYIWGADGAAKKQA